MNIDFKKLNENAVLPERGSDFAGGWDVVVTEIEKIGKDFAICKLGFALSLPMGHKLTLVPRSSLTKTHWVQQNSPGLGDEDYRGEYQFRFRCMPTGIKIDLYENTLTYDEFPFEVGDRIGQIYLETVIPIEFNEVDILSESNRNIGGFGSTGN